MKRRDVLIAMASTAASSWAATLSESDSRAFDAYCKPVEAGVRNAWWIDPDGTAKADLERGGVLAIPFSKPNPRPTGDSFIHDWVAAVRIRGGKASRLVAVLKDFEHHKKIYAPDVVDSRLISQDGETFRSFLRLRKKKILTAVFNSEYETRFETAKTSGVSIVHSTKFAEVQNAGRPVELELPQGTGNGFLWRLNSYWRWEEHQHGLLLELRSISLSRNVPEAVAWMVTPLITSMPRESLMFTLDRTAQALR